MPPNENQIQSLPEEKPSLAKLANQMESKKASVSPQVKERGDDVIAKAKQVSMPTGEEARLAQLYQESENIIMAKSQEDPVWGEKIGAKIDALTKAGKLDEIPQVIIDEADNEKIKLLEKERPEWFTSKDAAVSGFLNEATFGQLSKILGKAGELIGDRPYEEIVSEKAEQFRLLSKAFPGWTTAGQVGSYLMPGSPAKALFNGAAKLATRGAVKAATTSLVAKLVTNPNAVKALSSVAQSGLSAAAGTGAASFAKGALGENLEDMDLDRGVNEGLIGAVAGGVFGAGIPAAAMGLSKVAEKSAPIARGAARAVDKFLGRASGELTGTSERSLRAFNRNPEAIERAAKTNAYDAGLELVSTLEKKAFHSEAKKAADSILPTLPDVDAKPLINRLRSVKKSNNPDMDRAVTYLHEWADRIESGLARGPEKTIRVTSPDGLTATTKTVPGDVVTTVSAKQMAAWKKELQQAAESWGMDLGGKAAKRFLDAEVHQAARLARLTVEGAASTAAKSADPAVAKSGRLYIDSMRQAAKEARLVDSTLRMLGKTEEARRKNAETFFDRAFGKNRTIQLRRMEQLDKEFGTSFVEQAKNYQYAKDLGGKSGPAATPSFFNTNPTGRSAYGIAVGGALGAGNEILTRGDGEVFDAKTGAALGAVLTSPRVAAGVLGASGQMSGFVRRMLANPDALARVAGLAQKSGSQTAQRLAVPIEIRRVAQMVQNTLTKDGPRSAASLARNVADTPYFLGLVHYFDVAEKQSQGKKTRAALQREQYEDMPDVAR